MQINQASFLCLQPESIKKVFKETVPKVLKAYDVRPLMHKLHLPSFADIQHYKWHAYI